MSTISVGPQPLGGYNTTIYNQPTVQSATPIAWTTANSPITLFTISGVVQARIYGVVGATGFTSTGGTGTLAIGIAGTTGLLIAATTVDGTNLNTANTPWFTTAPTLLGLALSAEVLTFDMISSANIILTIATNNMTAGSIKVYCEWIPKSAGATVT